MKGEVSAEIESEENEEVDGVSKGSLSCESRGFGLRFGFGSGYRA